MAVGCSVAEAFPYSLCGPGRGWDGWRSLGRNALVEAGSSPRRRAPSASRGGPLIHGKWTGESTDVLDNVGHLIVLVPKRDDADAGPSRCDQRRARHGADEK